MVAIGQRIKDLRMSRGLTQEQLADILKISKSRIGMYEIGKREPNFEMLEAIADYFNVDMNYLLGKSDVPNQLVWASRLEEINQSVDLEKLKADISKEEQAEKIIVAKYGQDVWNALCLYIQLDTEDRAEVRGLMKGLYRHDKYSIQDGLKNA